jgi:hypothetical protein
MPEYDYYGLLASTWDIWRDDTADWRDRFFYRDIIGQYGPRARPALLRAGRAASDTMTAAALNKNCCRGWLRFCRSASPR